MSDGLADLLHDAAVLHGFVEFIEEYCREQERSQTYVDASGLFFEYIEELATGIRDELAKGVSRAKRFPERLPILRSNMLTLKGYLGLLHKLIKPAADAHTLTIPAPLIELASQQLQFVGGMKNSRIVILLTPELMYFQTSHTRVKEQAQFVQTFIPSATFPAKLGFIELPYSQGPSFFTNLAIYHEIGHFVYEELSNQDPPHADIAALKSAILRSLPKAFRKGRKDGQLLAYGTKILEYWTQEVFCDLFAIRLVGPAFCFALVEMLGMLGLLSRKATVRFSPTHPAPACRFAEHVNFLRDNSWWSAMADIEPSQKKLLERLARIPQTSYRFYIDENNRGPNSLVDAFLDTVVPAIRKLVQQMTPAAHSAAKQFMRTRHIVEECLREGVVPHRTNASPLDPISIINSAFFFYLTTLANLIKEFEGAEAASQVDKHSQWARRLEKWTMKAIEDSQIHTRFRRAEQHGVI